jgi:hypothetical protein
MRLRPNVALQQTGRLLMKRASRALLLIALQLNLGVRQTTDFSLGDSQSHTIFSALGLVQRHGAFRGLHTLGKATA